MSDRRDLTFEDLLRNAGASEARSRLEALTPDPGTLPGAPAGAPAGAQAAGPGGGCGSGSCGCGTNSAPPAPSNTLLDKPL
ncbi:MAG: hypothetical protein JSU98_16400, partial [Gemmatimonadales bacterium]